MNKPNSVIPNEDFTVALLPGADAIVSLNDIPKQRPITTVDRFNQFLPILWWGDNNTFPQDVIADVIKDPEIGTLLDKQASLLYSGGLIWGIPKLDGIGNKTLTPLPDPINLQIKTWLKRSNINRYLQEASKDLYWFNNVFVEVILQKDRTKIIQICTHAAEECRFEKQDPKTGLISTVYMNAQWPNGNPLDAFTKQVPLIDAYFDPAMQLRASSSGYNFIYPLNYGNPGQKFYQKADWNAIRASGWLAVSQLIPQFKKALLTNQMTIKYHIKISNMYWSLKYDGYDLKTAAEKTEIKTSELKSIQDVLSGAEKSGKSFVSPKYFDQNLREEIDLIEITAIDDKIQDGKYLEDGKDASNYKAAAIGLHQALLGTTPNSGMGGAGSNIREAYNLHVMTNRSRQDLILEPLNNLLIEYNGWPMEMEFAFNNQFMTTLDAGKEVTSATTSNPVKQ